MDKQFCLAIKFHKCKLDGDGFCLPKLQYGDCKSAIDKCQYPIKINPLCVCKSIEDCQGRYDIRDYDRGRYIFYTCHTSCSHFIRDLDSEESIDKIIKPIDSPHYYYGKPLDKLVKKVFKDEKPKSDVSRTVEFFEKAFKVINIS